MKKRSLVVGAALALASCGSSAETATSVPATEDSATQDSGATATTDASTTTTEAPATTATDVETITDYCEASAAAETLADEFDDVTDPEAVEVFWNQQIALLEGADHPAEIAAELEVLLDTFSEASEILEGHDYDFLAALVPLTEVMESAEFEAASFAVDTYEADACGFEPPEEAEFQEVAPAIDGAVEGSLTEDEIATIELLYETEAGREALAQGVSQTTNLTPAEALCLIEELGVEGVIGISVDDPGAEVLQLMLTATAACDLDLSEIS